MGDGRRKRWVRQTATGLLLISLGVLVMGFLFDHWWLTQQFASGDSAPSGLWKQYASSVCLSVGSLLLAAALALGVFAVVSSRTYPRPSREYSPEELGESPLVDP